MLTEIECYYCSLSCRLLAIFSSKSSSLHLRAFDWLTRLRTDVPPPPFTPPGEPENNGIIIYTVLSQQRERFEDRYGQSE